MGLQVDLLTKGKTCHAKEFIDFEFNGKHVSEFGLVVVSDGDRLSLDASPEFEDETSEVSGVDGQLYWGTRYKTRRREYKLATDGITEQQLNDFKKHFQPGQYGKLIEDERPYRYCYCRIDAVSNFSFIPFKKKTRVMGYDIEVNEYKGEATLSFVQDDPRIYSTANYLASAITAENAQAVLRGMYDNNIPHATSWAAIFDDQYSSVLGLMKIGHNIIGSSESAIKAVCFLGSDKVLQYDGTTSSLVNRVGYRPAYFTDPMIYYNPSTARCFANLELYMNLTTTAFSSTSFVPVYIANIADDINVSSLKGTEPYNRVESSQKFVMENGVITIKNPTFETTLKYTTPNVIHSVHRAIKIAWDFYNSGNNNIKDLEMTLQEEIIHPLVIERAMLVLSWIKARSAYYSGGVLKAGTISLPAYLYTKASGTFDANWFAYFNTAMLGFFCDPGFGGTVTPENYKSAALQQCTLRINGETSSSTFVYLSYNLKSSTGTFQSREERCGDIMLSDYLELSGGDTINSEGKVASCHCLRFMNGGNFTNHPDVVLAYKYTYL